jgi:hypothetical protein
MRRLYAYVGPKRIADRFGHAAKGIPVYSADDVLRWIRTTGQEVDHAGEIVVTFVIDDTGILRIADRRSEHVACSGGQPVLSAGEMTFRVVRERVVVPRVTNQSNGFCPEPESWPAIQTALQAAGFQSPTGFDPAFVFRLCECCNSINIVKEECFECAVCLTRLSAEWNLDRMPVRMDSTATPSGELTSEKLSELVKRHKPSQSWYDEDHEGLY